jgi:hypothetical protein
VHSRDGVFHQFTETHTKYENRVKIYTTGNLCDENTKKYSSMREIQGNV